ncbi:MAG: putative deoxyribonuclease RhsA [Syntrophorhabdus sp. PtaB.Bin006]|nr:MAG: putative deoxyribonuclease RhsA [Syntrophorhabdus sp. PtaB.Bin006]
MAKFCVIGSKGGIRTLQVRDEGRVGVYVVFLNKNPKTGKYITADPIGLAGGDVNYYVYTKGNPVNRKDPKGLADCPCGKWIGHGVDGSISGLYGGNISVMRYVLHQQKKMHYSNSMF